MPVSYTHLDVYKRQALHLLLGEPPCSGHTLMHLPASPVHTLAVLTADSKALSSLSLPATLRTLLLPVSYTHLDVYKRQRHLLSAAFQCLRRTGLNAGAAEIAGRAAKCMAA